MEGKGNLSLRFYGGGRSVNTHRIKKLLTLLRQGEFRLIWQKGIAFLSSRIYLFSAVRRDKRYGGISINRKIMSKYAAQGAYNTQSSDYRCLRRVFRAVPLRSDDVFVDVGCGEGRVLTYLYSKGFRGRAVGIELDEDVARTAAQRTSSCENISICCGNVLEQGELLRDATAVYLFNPFSRKVFQAFVEMLESVCEKPVRLYYLNCLYVREVEDRERWTCLSSGVIRRPGLRPMPFAIH